MQVIINNYGIKDPYVQGTIDGRTAAHALMQSAMGES